MKLSKSKLAMAKVINENGGWADDSAYAANDEGGIICGYSSKPNRSKLTSYFWSGCQRNTWIRGIKTPQWHQCVLSREEYHQAYPKADADGWIEWNGGECPVDNDSLVDVKFPDGSEYFNTDAYWDWSSAAFLSQKQNQPSSSWCRTTETGWTSQTASNKMLMMPRRRLMLRLVSLSTLVRR